MTRVTLLYFAALRDLTGAAEETRELPSGVTNVRELLTHLELLHPALAGRLGPVRVAIDESFVSASESVCDGAVVALIPPVSGG